MARAKARLFVTRMASISVANAMATSHELAKETQEVASRLASLLPGRHGSEGA